jgi:hypothetical protein
VTVLIMLFAIGTLASLIAAFTLMFPVTNAQEDQRILPAKKGVVRKLCLKSQESNLTRVSTTCGSGWVDHEHAILLWILNSAG